MDTRAIDASLGRPDGQDHQGTGANLNQFPRPLSEPELGARRTPAEEARTIVAATRLAALATLSEDGSPWSSVVGYGVQPDGAIALVVSTLAEHGRNLERDARASVSVAAPVPDGVDPLDAGRVTLLGRVHVPEGAEADAALAAHCEAYPAARAYAKFGDFTLYLLRPERVRWVGGFGRMDSATGADYAEAEPDPVDGERAESARTHLNEDHADALLLMAQEIAGYSDATAAFCERLDRYGMDLKLRTLRGTAWARVGWKSRAEETADLRKLSVELVRYAEAKRAGGESAPAL
ncbi:MAG: pyridoxamine 5'-phosphate oxidase family protein [Solirubrobacteraceae bacterium]|nr:pyridoxamine 5'-phosphate oxidase family protein [Solirubrobacteraceae bacterium]